MSRNVTSRVTHASYIANVGSCRTIGSSQATAPSPTSIATTVEAIGFDMDASWKIVWASTGAAAPACWTPKLGGRRLGRRARQRSTRHAALPQRIARNRIELRKGAQHVLPIRGPSQALPRRFAARVAQAPMT